MTRALTLFAGAAALLVMHPALAQETIPLDSIPLVTQPAQPAQPIPAQPQPVPAQPQPVPAQPQPVPAQPSIVQQPPATNQAAAPSSLRAAHGAWQIRCLSNADCVMTQIHRRTAGTADVVFTVIKPKGLNDTEGNSVPALAEIVVPLGVYLPGGLGLKIDQHPARAVPFERCIEEGCVVRAPISPTVLEQLKAGITATIVIFGAPERPVQIPISLAGFTNAFNAI